MTQYTCRRPRSKVTRF